MKYHPGINGGKFLSPGDEGYDDEEAFEVIVQVGIRDIDKKPREQEIKENMDNSFTIKFVQENPDLAGEALIVNPNAGFGGSLSFNPKTSELSVRTAENPEEYTLVTNASEASLLKPAFNILKLYENGGAPHFSVNLDDYNGSSDIDGSITSHEFGHIEGFILFPLNTAYFHTGNRNTQNGHSTGNASGVNAKTRQAQYDQVK